MYFYIKFVPFHVSLHVFRAFLRFLTENKHFHIVNMRGIYVKYIIMHEYYIKVHKNT